MKKFDFKKLVPKFKKVEWPKINKFRKDAPLALLSYLHFLVIIPLIVGRKNEFVHYHAKQGFLLLIIWVLAGFSLYIPYIPWLFFLILLVGVLFGIIFVLLGKAKPMPIIGKLAEKMNI